MLQPLLAVTNPNWERKSPPGGDDFLQRETTPTWGILGGVFRRNACHCELQLGWGSSCANTGEGHRLALYKFFCVHRDLRDGWFSCDRQLQIFRTRNY